MAASGTEEVLQSLIDTLELCAAKIKGNFVQRPLFLSACCISDVSD